MNFSYPDFLAPSLDNKNNQKNENVNLHQNANDFNDLLYNRLASLDQSHLGHSPTSGPMAEPSYGHSQFSPHFAPSSGSFGHDTFNLPIELQGGIGTISSRRPSYAAESFTRSDPPFSVPGGASNSKNTLATFAAVNNYNNHRFNLDMLNDSFTNFNLNSNFSDFQQRRPSQLVEFQSLLAPNPPELNLNQPASSLGTADGTANGVNLENGLLFHDQYILASPELKQLYLKAAKYFQNVDTTAVIISQIEALLNKPQIIRMITFIKNLNNLTFNHKLLCLVINKNGKFDLLSYPNSSNVSLRKNDLVVVDGDRGKDLVMILEPLVNLNFAILFNFIKKLEHLKSLTIYDSHQKQMSSKKNCGGTHSTAMDATAIINSPSNEDNEFIITLPTKQVLRLATPKEVQKLSNKFLEEKRAFVTCYNKIKELNLNNDLQLINVEYQFDFKKLIFYYFAGFKRIDFRGLIKELFKIYKTRIWLCAVLPYDKPETYITMSDGTSGVPKVTKVVNLIPHEYDLTNEEVANFSLDDLERVASPEYFHLRNLLNLIQHVNNEVNGNFYGFNKHDQDASSGGIYETRANIYRPPKQPSAIASNFNPFGDGGQFQ